MRPPHCPPPPPPFLGRWPPGPPPLPPPPAAPPKNAGGGGGGGGRGRGGGGGGSVGAAFNDEVTQVREQLRVIYKTPEVASHPVVAHPRVAERVRKSVTKAFLALEQDEAGRALLKGIRTPAPVVANYEHDYLPLEKLKLQKY